MSKAIFALAMLAIPAVALAHPLGTAYASRGECEAALAKANHNGGAIKVETGEFENLRESNRWMHDTFRCEEIGDDWYIILSEVQAC